MPPVSFPSTIGLDFEWLYPEPAVINYRLLQIEEYLENIQALAELAKQSLQYDMAQRFSTETDPEGFPWEPLVQPAPEQQGVLQLTGEMRESALSEEAWTAIPAGVFFDTSVLPDYWIFHEQPEGQAAQRIPQRSFIGASDIEGERIERLGDEWLAGGITMAGVFRREVRAPAGIFARIR